jgi:hypothetical protein
MKATRMPKDNGATQRPSMPTFAEILADLDADDYDPVELTELPPFAVTAEVKRTPRTQPIPDLSDFVKLWQLIGEGNTGKTFLARYLIEKIIDAGKAGATVVAALAPGNRNLTAFAPGTMQPPSADPAATAEWAGKRLKAMQKGRYNGVWDFGGGDQSQRIMIEAQPDMAERAEEEGMSIVAAYTLGPRVDDLIFLKTCERIGFRPRATALILNLGLVDSPAAFNDVRRQPEYKAALDRGAVELWLPALPEKIALEIERARALFRQARDGEAPAGKRAAVLSLTERAKVREWLGVIDAELSAIEKAGWMPWT